MYCFGRTQSPGNICIGFNVTFKFDQNLLQNIFVENGCTERFLSSPSVGRIVNVFQLVFINCKELVFQ